MRASGAGRPNTTTSIRVPRSWIQASRPKSEFRIFRHTPLATQPFSAAAASVLSYLFPSGATSFASMRDEAGISRLYGGIHYRSDIDAGKCCAVRRRSITLAGTLYPLRQGRTPRCSCNDRTFYGEATGTAAFLPSSIPNPITIVPRTSAADVKSGTVFPK